MSQPVEINIGEAVTFSVDLDSSETDSDYTLPSTGVELRVGAAGSPFAAEPISVSVTSTTEGTVDVVITDDDSYQLMPGIWTGALIDTAGPLLLGRIILDIKFLPGILESVVGGIETVHFADADKTGTNVVLERGAAHTLFFCLPAFFTDEDLYVTINGDRFAAELALVDSPHLVKCEIDTTPVDDDDTTFDFSLGQIGVESEDDVGTVVKHYSAFVTMREV